MTRAITVMGHPGLANTRRLAASTATSFAAPSPVSIASRSRTKLWELNPSVHCSIIGTCLTTGELRRTMGRLANSHVGHLTDHELHSEAVGLCGHHNPCSKLLNKTLDQRHHIAIKQFGRLQGEAAVLEKWREARQAGDIPGAYWAVLTHPDVGHTGNRHAFGDVHMLSHLIGSANRADVKRLAVLETEKAELMEKVERQQVRLCEAITSRDTTIRQLRIVAEARVVATGSHQDDDTIAGFRNVTADLQARLAAEIGRRERFEQRLAEAADAAQTWERRALKAEAERDALADELITLEAVSTTEEADVVLPAIRLLYVGGRPSVVEQIRQALAADGGTLLVHDGGRHDHISLLAGLISQADHVAFPVDCVSHDAALTVKRLCRQLGTTWSPLRSSGFSSVVAALSKPIAPLVTE